MLMVCLHVPCSKVNMSSSNCVVAHAKQPKQWCLVVVLVAIRQQLLALKMLHAQAVYTYLQ